MIYYGYFFVMNELSAGRYHFFFTKSASIMTSLLQFFPIYTLLDSLLSQLEKNQQMKQCKINQIRTYVILTYTST